MARSWRPARSLEVLLAQVKASAPKDRNNELDAFIGDAAHSKRKSDHNPDRDGVVKALDITNDPSRGVVSRAIVEHFRKVKDWRVRYAISNDEIYGNEDYCRTNGGKPWVWQEYNGPNPHTMHCHVSVVHDKKTYDDTSPWPLMFKTPAVSAPGNIEPMPVLRRGSRGVSVQLLQGKLKVDVDGHFGPQTEKAVKAFQTKNKLGADGVVGPYTWQALLK